MKRTVRNALQLLAVSGVLAGATMVATSPAHATLPDVSCGTVSSADTTAAAQLNQQLTGSLRNAMNAYRMSCARAIVNTVRANGLPQQAEVIAITTAIVESTLRNNPNMEDHGSVGLFQQRASWGTTAQRLDPATTTRKFISAMLSTYPNNSWQGKPVGEVCQGVQQSAYPSLYQGQVADAQKIVNAIGQSPAVPVGMTGFASADFNGDGKTDLAAVDAATGKMYLYPGTGVGTFGERSLIGTGCDTVSNVTPGDFNGDGKIDLAAVNTANGNLYVYPGNGAGAFGTPWLAGTGWNNLDHLMGGDFNGDGKSDIAAVGVADGNLYVYPGNGAGSFAAPINAGTGWNTLGKFATGDFNGDGKSDIAAVGVTDGNLYVYPGNGAGSFAAPVNAGTGWNIMRDLIGGDFNADGKTDVAAVQAPQGSTGDMYFYPGTGQNTFGNRTSIGTGW
ncbi:VCBS repeat-containing protein [Kitasatospora sp. NBC_01300]|uniref:FG-GAP repeat domain-containing protein n=1 Tax=Kitasatospora sp. NBC_01300 TaxID=2903574 RepID=UPI002F90DBED|nr:VCBS repeat-containing protein [Kitasatospora sp. NBC_01300]